MRFGITTKLFLAILLTNVMIALAFAIANQISVDRGFREYVRDREHRRLEFLSEDLASVYLNQGRTWDTLRNNEQEWRRVTRQDRGFGAHGAPPGPPLPSSAFLRPAGPVDPAAAPHEADGRPRPMHARGPLPFRAGLPPWSFQLSLFDASRTPIAGPPLGTGDEVLWQPVRVDGNDVGWIAARSDNFAGPDMQFLEQQLRTSWVIVAVAVVLAAIVAVALARGFLSPIRGLARATHRLAAGDYRQQIQTGRRDELGQLVQDFNHLAETLRKGDELRLSFLADVSHELRTPLAVLRGELEALQDGVRSLTADAIKSLQTEVATLGALIDDLYDLALSDIGALVMHKESVDLADLVRITVRGFEPRFADRGLVIDAAGIPTARLWINGDARRLTQVVNNLLENSVRYTDRGGVVQIDMHRDHAHVVLDVKDSAPAVPRELLPRLGERLFRVEGSRNRESGGAGLGLSLCASIVNAHGGTLEARPCELGGLWVQVRLPSLRGHDEH